MRYREAVVRTLARARFLRSADVALSSEMTECEWGGGMTRWARERNAGLALCIVVGLVSYAAWWFTRGSLSISPLLWALVAGIAIGNLTRIRSQIESGARFSSTAVLKVAVASLGLVVSASAWWQLGWLGVSVVLLNMLISITAGLILCSLVFRLGTKQSVLITVGTAICGASAIAAVAPSIEAESKETGLALAVVTLFGLSTMLLFPALYSMTPLGTWLGSNPAAFGLWSGTGIHETAQVVASASQVEGALDMAMLAKSIRIFMIGPVVLLAALYVRSQKAMASAGSRRIAIPWFSVAFVLLTFVHTGLAAGFGESWAFTSSRILKPLISFALTVAFAGIGLRIRLRDLVGVGARAFVGGLLVALVASGSALVLTKVLWLALSR